MLLVTMDGCYVVSCNHRLRCHVVCMSLHCLNQNNEYQYAQSSAVVALQSAGNSLVLRNTCTDFAIACEIASYYIKSAGATVDNISAETKRMTACLFAKRANNKRVTEPTVCNRRE